MIRKCLTAGWTVHRWQHIGGRWRVARGGHESGGFKPSLQQTVRRSRWERLWTSSTTWSNLMRRLSKTRVTLSRFAAVRPNLFVESIDLYHIESDCRIYWSNTGIIEFVSKRLTDVWSSLCRYSIAPVPEFGIEHLYQALGTSHNRKTNLTSFPPASQLTSHPFDFDVERLAPNLIQELLFKQESWHRRTLEQTTTS